MCIVVVLSLHVYVYFVYITYFLSTFILFTLLTFFSHSHVNVHTICSFGSLSVAGTSIQPHMVSGAAYSVPSTWTFSGAEGRVVPLSASELQSFGKLYTRFVKSLLNLLNMTLIIISVVL